MSRTRTTHLIVAGSVEEGQGWIREHAVDVLGDTRSAKIATNAAAIVNSARAAVIPEVVVLDGWQEIPGTRRAEIRRAVERLDLKAGRGLRAWPGDPLRVFVSADGPGVWLQAVSLVFARTEDEARVLLAESLRAAGLITEANEGRLDDLKLDEYEIVAGGHVLWNGDY